jgi:hypothetical protein
MKDDIDISLQQYLDQKELEVKQTLIMTIYAVGKILHEVKTKLEGTQTNFNEWVIKIGIAIPSARNYIKYYEINEKNGGTLKKLPMGLVIEFDKEDTSEDLKGKVLNGEIKTEKKLKELKKENVKLKESLEIITAQADDFESKYTEEKNKYQKTYKEYEQLLDISARKDMAIEQSGKRNEAELESLMIDILTYIGERTPKVKHFLSKIDADLARSKVEYITTETNKLLSVLN